MYINSRGSKYPIFEEKIRESLVSTKYQLLEPGTSNIGYFRET